MTQRLECHRDYARFLTDELEKLASLSLSWEQCYKAVLESSPTSDFDAAVEKFCESLEWPTLEGMDLARACGRLHFAVWAAHKLPWEVVDCPPSGADYLKKMLIDRYWIYRQQWILEAWAEISS